MATGLSRDDLRELVHAAAAGLSPKDREVFELGMRHDLQAAEIGKALGVADNAAHALLSRVRTQFSRALGALVVARQGRGACAELDGLLRGWDGSFDPLWRKRIARHVDECPTCTTVQSREVTASALLAVMPFAVAPVVLRSRLFGPGADPQSLVGYAQGLAERAGPFNPDGFPVPLEPYADEAPGEGGHGPTGGEAAPTVLLPPGPPPPGRQLNESRTGRRKVLGLAAALLLLLGGGTAWLGTQGSGDEEPVAMPATTAAADPSPAPTTPPTPRSGGDGGDLAQPPLPPAAGGDVPAGPPALASPGPREPAPEPSGTPFAAPTPTPVPTFTAVDVGSLRLVPGSLTLPPGGAGTVRLTAVGGPVEWSATRSGAAARLVSLSAASGSLAPGSSTSVTVTVSSATGRAVTELVVIVGPGDHRLVIAVDHPPVPG